MKGGRSGVMNRWALRTREYLPEWSLSVISAGQAMIAGVMMQLDF